MLDDYADNLLDCSLMLGFPAESTKSMAKVPISGVEDSYHIDSPGVPSKLPGASQQGVLDQCRLTKLILGSLTKVSHNREFARHSLTRPRSWQPIPGHAAHPGFPGR